MRPASCSSTRSTRSAASAAPGLGGGNDEREQTLNQLLVEMDGFEGNAGVIVIAATNRPTCSTRRCCARAASTARWWCRCPISAAASRSCRCTCARCRSRPTSRPTSSRAARPGFSGADLANLVNEAALFAARGNKRLVDMDDFERAKDKIIMGAERRSMVMPEEERRNTAYHESGPRGGGASCCRRPTRCTRSPSSRAAARWA